MKKSVKIIILVVVLIGLAGVSVGYYLFNKKQADMTTQKADITITATALYSDYSSDENAANTKYLNKTMDVTGTVSEVLVNTDGSLSVALKEPNADFGINCNILKPATGIKEKLVVGKKVLVRGVCSGYNSIEVALNNCALIE